MYPNSSMLEIADHCFTYIDHDERLGMFCAFKQICLQALSLNLVINLKLVGFFSVVLGGFVLFFFIPDLSQIFDMCSAAFHI